MDLINKCLNHLTWILNATKEQNRLLFQEIKLRMNEKPFILNKNFQKYFYTFTIYLKLSFNIEKGYRLLLSGNKINKKSVLSLRNTYLLRAAIQFRESGNYLKASRSEIDVPSALFASLYGKMKAVSSLLLQLENDMDYLIRNLY